MIDYEGYQNELLLTFKLITFHFFCINILLNNQVLLLKKISLFLT
jgi:hypothetical protein